MGIILEIYSAPEQLMVPLTAYSPTASGTKTLEFAPLMGMRFPEIGSFLAHCSTSKLEALPTLRVTFVLPS